MFECSTTTLASGENALQHDEFECFVVLRQYKKSVFRAFTEAAGNVIPQFCGHRPDFKQIDTDIAVFWVFTKQLNLMDMLAQVLTAHTQRCIIRNICSFIYV